MHCPRKGNISPVFKFGQEEDTYNNHVCSWCGGLSGEEFMRRVEEGTIEMSGTDKNYKVYIRATEGSERLSTIKFYFQHLDEPQMRRFVDLYNQRKIKFYNGGLYVSPFFMTNL